MAEEGNAAPQTIPVEQVQYEDVGGFEQDLATKYEESQAHAEPETETPEVKEEQTDEFSSKFAALSRKEKDIRSREDNLKQQIAEYEARMQELETPQEPEEAPRASLEHRLRTNPIETMEEMGYTYEQLTDIILNDGKLPQDRQVDLRFEQMEKQYEEKLQEIQNRLADKETQEEEQKFSETINNFKNDINTFVDGSEDFELIQANDAHDLVYDVIEAHYEENNEILDMTVAAQEVEQYLEQELKKVVSKTKKIASWIEPSESQNDVKQHRQEPTLSNSQAVAGVNKSTGKMLSREQSLAKLAEQIKWK